MPSRPGTQLRAGPGHGRGAQAAATSSSRAGSGRIAAGCTRCGKGSLAAPATGVRMGMPALKRLASVAGQRGRSPAERGISKAVVAVIWTPCEAEDGQASPKCEPNQFGAFDVRVNAAMQHYIFRTRPPPHGFPPDAGSRTRPDPDEGDGHRHRRRRHRAGGDAGHPAGPGRRRRPGRLGGGAGRRRGLQAGHRHRRAAGDAGQSSSATAWR